MAKPFAINLPVGKAFVACLGAYGSTSWGAPVVRWALAQPTVWPIVGLPRGVTSYSQVGVSIDIDDRGHVVASYATNLTLMVALMTGIQRMIRRGGTYPASCLNRELYPSLPTHLQLVTSPRVGGLVDHRILPRIARYRRYSFVRATPEGRDSPIADVLALDEHRAHKHLCAFMYSGPPGCPMWQGYPVSAHQDILSWLEGRPSAARLVEEPSLPDPLWHLHANAAA
jgi:hypothetical protein